MAMLPGIISNWLVYFISQMNRHQPGADCIYSQGLVVLGIFTIIGGITAFGRFLMLSQIL